MRWLKLLVFILPGLLLAVFASSKFVSGLKRDAAFPAPVYMQMNVALPFKSYVQAERLLTDASDIDGDGRLAAAEAAFHANGNAVATSLARQAIALSPANPRSWVLLAAATRMTDPSLSHRAMAMALELAPNDFYVAGFRAREAAVSYQSLDPDARDAALVQARLLWSEPLLHPAFYDLVAAQGGAALVTRAYRGKRRTIRAINRWLRLEARAREARGKAEQGQP